MTYVSRTYPTEVAAHEIAETLESFGLRPNVMGPIVGTMLDGSGEVTCWEVSLVVPPRQPDAPRVVAPWPDRDEAVDYVDTHWDREAEDREYDRRHDHDR